MTIKELAQELDISTTTVSRVLTGQEKKYRISPKTALRVRNGARKHKFEPNQIARNLRLQETNTIGLIIPDISNPFFANLARTVEIELRKRDKMILLCDTKDETLLEEESLNLLLGRKVDGLLVAPVGKKCDHFIKNSKIPLVLIDRYFKDQTIPFVTADNFQSAYFATEFLIHKGHQNIACIQGLGYTSVNENRILGYSQAMEDHKIPTRFTQISGSGYSIENGYESTKELLQKKNRPTAIFALNNQIALGAMKAIKEAGLHIPEDISLIAFDEQPYFELLSPALTAIKQPMQGIGKVAVETLFRLMAGENVKNQMLAPNFIERESVKSISL
ncbi:LacI family DNA-binding transcriptional regulator [Ulvibacterium sp.]|uniref:LacI family DNA-binding transcriptional regulator n=1 Tax=Ulvibacterium sp. TaxID=2665914 RepID=UPI003CC652D3